MDNQIEVPKTPNMVNIEADVMLDGGIIVYKGRKTKHPSIKCPRIQSWAMY